MVELDNLDPFMLRPVEKTALEPSRYKPLISSTKTNYLASFKIAYTVNISKIILANQCRFFKNIKFL
jgi:hypothetical protein